MKKNIKFVTAFLLCVGLAGLMTACQGSRSNWLYAPQQPPPPPTPPNVETPLVVPTPPPVAQFPETDSSVAAVAFEDMSPTRNDEDFNDFLTDFKIYEKINDKNQATNIVIDFYPRAVGASYDHSFLMVINGVKDSPTDVKNPKMPALIHGAADVTLTYYLGSGKNAVGPGKKVSADHDIVIFPSTHALFVSQPGSREIINTYADRPYLAPNTRARLSITLLDPSLNPIDPKRPIDVTKFRMMLHVKDTSRDIDIIDVDEANFDQNKTDEMYYPFGFIIPVNWRWPIEGAQITQAYPSFQGYRDFLRAHLSNPSLTPSDDVAHWYNAAPVLDKVYTDHGRPIPQPELLDDPW